MLVSAFVVGCGSSPKHAAAPGSSDPSADPIPKTAGPSCKAVVEHLATLADRDPTKPAKGDATLRGRCESDAWSDDARNCFATAQSDGELDGCKSMLTPGQREAFAVSPATPASAPAPAPAAEAAPKHGTRGPVPKGKTGDPDEGGE
ncbi:MAG: hypothetical protein ACM31C_29905 [Acidobacteriota bacterium]